jgi:phospholipase/carboxylesterase
MSNPVTLQALPYTEPGGQQPDWQLIMLHGWGANAADLLGLAPYLRLSNFSMLFPDAPWPHPQVPGGRMWYSFPFGYDFRQPHDFDQQEDLQTTRQLLQTWLLEVCQTSQIPLKRTILAGFSQGGAMNLDIGSHLPLAGQVVLSGYLHSEFKPPVSDRKLLMVHGRFDPVVPFEKAQSAQTSLLEKGQPVDFHDIAMGHEILPEVIQLISAFCEDLRQGHGQTSA